MRERIQVFDPGIMTLGFWLDSFFIPFVEWTIWNDSSIISGKDKMIERRKLHIPSAVRVLNARRVRGE